MLCSLRIKYQFEPGTRIEEVSVFHGAETNNVSSQRA